MYMFPNTRGRLAVEAVSCRYMYIYIHVHTYMYTRTYIYLHVCNTCIYINMYAYIIYEGASTEAYKEGQCSPCCIPSLFYIYVHVYAYIYMCICVIMYIYIYSIHIYVYSHTCIYTSITYMYACIIYEGAAKGAYKGRHHQRRLQ